MHHIVLRRGFIVVMAAALCMVAISTATAFGGSTSMGSPAIGKVVVAGGGPDPSPTPKPSPTPPQDPAPPAPAVVAAPPKKPAIILTVNDPPPGAWSSVQWLNLAGTQWTDVPSWLGPLAQSTYGWMPLWIDDKDKGTGPFRWVVYDKDPRQGGKVWGMTQAFYFPATNEWEGFTVNKGDMMAANSPGAAYTSVVVFPSQP